MSNVLATRTHFVFIPGYLADLLSARAVDRIMLPVSDEARVENVYTQADMPARQVPHLGEDRPG